MPTKSDIARKWHGQKVTPTKKWQPEKVAGQRLIVESSQEKSIYPLEGIQTKKMQHKKRGHLLAEKR